MAWLCALAPRPRPPCAPAAAPPTRSSRSRSSSAAAACAAARWDGSWRGAAWRPPAAPCWAGGRRWRREGRPTPHSRRSALAAAAELQPGIRLPQGAHRPARGGSGTSREVGGGAACGRAGGKTPKPAAASLDALPGAVLPQTPRGRCQQSLSRCRRLQRAGRHEWGSALLCGEPCTLEAGPTRPHPLDSMQQRPTACEAPTSPGKATQNPASPFLFSQNSQIVDVGEKGMAGRGHRCWRSCIGATAQEPLAAPRLLLSPEHRSPSPLDRPSNLSTAPDARLALPRRTCKLPSRPGGSCVPAMTTSDAGHKP